jgi:hypothetical protein
MINPKLKESATDTRTGTTPALPLRYASGTLRSGVWCQGVQVLHGSPQILSEST